MPITDNIVGYWNLDEASGTRNDSGPNGLHVTASTSSPTGTTGPGSHNATLFTRSNSQYLARATASALQLSGTDFTVCGWVNLTTITQDFVGFCCHGQATGLTRSWQVYMGAVATPTLACSVYPDGTNGGGPVDSNFGSLGTGTWRFVIAEYTFSTSTLGVSTNLGTPVTSVRTDNFVSTGQFGFGWREDPGGGYELDGALAMWGFWKRLLTSGEKTTLYNSGNGMSWAELSGDPNYKIQLYDSWAQDIV